MCLSRNSDAVAPSCNGFEQRVENTLSTTSVAPASCAISATALMSITSRVGLVGVSRKNVLAGAHRLAPGIEIGAVHQRGCDAVARQVPLDHVEAGAEQSLEATIWSPARTCPISAVVTAAIPVAVARRRRFERHHALLEHRHRGLRSANTDSPALVLKVFPR
jgi:hypothetical protein